MACSQILMHRQGPEQGFWRCFADGLNQNLVLSVAQANKNKDPDKRVFLGVAETIVSSLLCCGVGIVQCLFNLLYYVIGVRNTKKPPDKQANHYSSAL